jgi:hypothetical protein
LKRANLREQQAAIHELTVALNEGATALADFRAIIFVGTQMAARAAVAHLSIRAAADGRGRNETCGSGLSWVRPGMLLGQNAMKKAKQCEALDQFRRGHINVLMATSIAEEGLDIQRCGIVIRTEPPRYEYVNLPGYEYAPSPGRTSEPRPGCENVKLFWFQMRERSVPKREPWANMSPLPPAPRRISALSHLRFRELLSVFCLDLCTSQCGAERWNISRPLTSDAHVRVWVWAAINAAQNDHF